MQIKEPSDDARLAALNRRLEQTAETRQPEELSPIARPRPVGERLEQQYQSRKKKDRRRGDRRKEDREVLLDTRSNRERRKGPRRSKEKDDVKGELPDRPLSGIDVKC